MLFHLLLGILYMRWTPFTMCVDIKCVKDILFDMGWEERKGGSSFNLFNRWLLELTPSLSSTRWGLLTDKKNLFIYKENQMGSGAKSYMRKGFLVWGNAQIFSPYLRRSLVIYDFAPDPSEFPYIWGKFYFLFYQCSLPYSRAKPEFILPEKKNHQSKWC